MDLLHLTQKKMDLLQWKMDDMNELYKCYYMPHMNAFLM